MLIFSTCTNASPAATKTGILKGPLKMKNVIKAIIVVSAFLGMTNVALASTPITLMAKESFLTGLLENGMYVLDIVLATVGIKQLAWLLSLI